MANAQSTKVLMVDDDKMLLDMYKERLELAGFQVETSTNGEECLAKIQQAKPDIVLLDIMMPKVNGYETLASIKSDPQTKEIPVIILSALVRDINKSRAIEAGADDYIIKSEVMPADVIKKIENVLAKYHKNVMTKSVTEAIDEEPKDKNPQPPAVPSADTTPTPAAPPAPPPPSESAEIQFEPSAKPAVTPKKAVAKPNTGSPLLLILVIILIVVIGVFFVWCLMSR